jgi:hypothetical protein
MPKFIGNRVGAAVTHGHINQNSNAPGIAKGGVFNVFDQYYFAKLERWTGIQLGQQDVTSRLSSTGLATPAFDGGSARYFIWTGPGSLTLSAGPNISAEYVVVGGGGGGGRANTTGAYNNAGGGGAGGFRTGTATITAGTTPITVGAGGVPAASNPIPSSPLIDTGRNGENGVPTVWTGLITSQGGGGGGGGAPGLGYANGRSGGSGGGSGGYGSPEAGLGSRVVDTVKKKPPISCNSSTISGK